MKKHTMINKKIIISGRPCGNDNKYFICKIKLICKLRLIKTHFLLVFWINTSIIILNHKQLKTPTIISYVSLERKVLRYRK